MHPLDNVIWKALTTRQAQYAECFDQACRFMPEVSPLAGFREPTPEGYASLAGLLNTRGTVGLFLEVPYQARAGWGLVAGAPMPEMVYEGSGDAGLRSADSRERLSPHRSDPEIVELGAEDSPEMMALTAL